MTRVMVSSEDPTLAGELVRQARAHGRRLTIATSTNTLDQARLMMPELLILDINQRIDGRLLLARLKQDARTASLRVVVLSARNDESIQRFCREMRVADFQMKPLTPNYFSRVLSDSPMSAVASR